MANLAATAAAAPERHRILAAPVLDADGIVRGVVHLHDLLRAGAA
ncbi:MAG: hypothetical protein R3B35_08900 [Gemmatimonadales bacterium]